MQIVHCLVLARDGIDRIVMRPDPLQLEERDALLLDGEIGAAEFLDGDIAILARDVHAVALEAVENGDAVFVGLREGEGVLQRIGALILHTEAIGPRHAWHDDAIAEGLIVEHGEVLRILPGRLVALGDKDDGRVIGVLRTGERPGAQNARQRRDDGEQQADDDQPRKTRRDDRADVLMGKRMDIVVAVDIACARVVAFLARIKRDAAVLFDECAAAVFVGVIPDAASQLSEVVALAVTHFAALRALGRNGRGRHGRMKLCSIVFLHMQRLLQRLFCWVIV